MPQKRGTKRKRQASKPRFEIMARIKRERQIASKIVKGIPALADLEDIIDSYLNRTLDFDLCRELLRKAREKSVYWNICNECLFYGAMQSVCPEFFDVIRSRQYSVVANGHRDDEITGESVFLQVMDANDSVACLAERDGIASPTVTFGDREWKQCCSMRADGRFSELLVPLKDVNPTLYAEQARTLLDDLTRPLSSTDWRSLTVEFCISPLVLIAREFARCSLVVLSSSHLLDIFDDVGKLFWAQK